MEESKRQSQVTAEIQRIVGAAFLQLEFPGNALVTITRVTVAADMSQATIYLSVIPDHSWNGVKNVLKKEAREIQDELNSQLTMRKTPTLRYLLDEREQQARKMEALLDEVAKDE